MKIKMAIKSFFIAAALAVSADVAAASDTEEYTIWGEYATRCSFFLEAEQEKGRKQESLVNHIVGWVQGALFIRGNQLKISQFADGKDILRIVREYCEENPLDNLVTTGLHVLHHYELQEAGKY